MNRIDISSKKSNVLPNTYIPVLSKKILINILLRLPKLSLIEFIQIWPRLINTQPYLNEQDKYHNQKSFNLMVIKEAKDLKLNITKIPKRKVIEIIINKYWTRGLNLLQLSQLDCQMIVDRPNSFYWIKSTIQDTFGKEIPISFDPQKFLDSLVKDLNALYLTYIYICKHPNLPSTIIRIQLFDLQGINMNDTNSLSRPHISSHRAHFIAIPQNSPHILHSASSDIISNLILQSVERNLPQNPHNLLKLITDDKQIPVRSLESMHILHGNSRFSNSLGVWTPYADGTADTLPLTAPDKHPIVVGQKHEEEQEEQEEQEKQEKQEGDGDSLEMIQLKKIANLRFKGSSTGILKSSKLYDDVNNNKRKRRRIFQNDEDNIDEFDTIITNKFSSIAPVQHADFIIKEKITETHESNIMIRFNGSDVFGGLHELSVLTTNKEKMILDPSEVPGWLTGEEGANSGIIKNSQFIKSSSSI
ncbi:putative cell segregation machinery component [Scheffersomyces amazonensis]|uniref:putative cell segregation machinery component n=1 Tax=Scheffersomyces amazonensis TaxID=1078765 RepID=UPI00315C6E35